MNIYGTGIAGLLLAAVPVVSAQQGVTKEICGIFESYIALADTLTPLLKEAQDMETADKTADKLHAILPKVYEARSAISAIPELDANATKELERRYGHRARVSWGGVFQEIFRLQKRQCFGSTSLAREFNILCMMLQ